MSAKDEAYLEKLKQLKSILPSGYTKIIAKEMSVTDMTVSNALLGRTRRYDIVECAIRLAEKRKNVIESLEEVIK